MKIHSMGVRAVIAMTLLLSLAASEEETAKGSACANCIELEAAPLALAITVDMAGTIILMMIIYKCTKKKSSAGSTQASKAPARAGGRAPPVPSPDYEALNPHTRSQDPYAIVSRTG
uniref:CD3 epsilon splice variant n=1 Tax=Hippoglossus hippoglossus TaxID=8267 RepID=D0QTE4_HIPHI|nr:CD3 epsilon splice variant [Hippoglossus hippoglossus]